MKNNVTTMLIHSTVATCGVTKSVPLLVFTTDE